MSVSVLFSVVRPSGGILFPSVSFLSLLLFLSSLSCCFFPLSPVYFLSCFLSLLFLSSPVLGGRAGLLGHNFFLYSFFGHGASFRRL
jgi:hypothetical protein